jgi:hypothetical protein
MLKVNDSKRLFQFNTHKNITIKEHKEKRKDQTKITECYEVQHTTFTSLGPSTTTIIGFELKH